MKNKDRIKVSSYNYVENSSFERSESKRYRVLHKLLNVNEIYNAKFDSVGDSINVGCGQMASKKLEKIRGYKNV